MVLAPCLETSSKENLLKILCPLMYPLSFLNAKSIFQIQLHCILIPFSYMQNNKTSRCTRLGLRPVSFTSVATAGLYCRPPGFTVMPPEKYLAGGLQSGCTANLWNYGGITPALQIAQKF